MRHLLPQHPSSQSSGLAVPRGFGACVGGVVLTKRQSTAVAPSAVSKSAVELSITAAADFEIANSGEEVASPEGRRGASFMGVVDGTQKFTRFR